MTSSLRFGRLALALAIGILVVGLVQLHGATVDVYPEFEAPAVEIQAEALGLSAQEVEQLITVPMEQDLLNGVPWLAHISSRSMPGLSTIDLEFEPGTDLYQARQMVQERMTQAKALPNVGTPPIMTQPTSATSRVAMVAMTSRTVSTMEMSVLARWQIRPRLMAIPGVARVSVWGQRDRQLQVLVDPGRMHARNVSLTELIESTGNALWVSPLSFVEASTPGTGGFVETHNQRLGVQHVQPITSAEQLADVAVEGTHRSPLRIGDVAQVREDHQPLIGDARTNGSAGLMLVVERFPGANTRQVTQDVEAALDAMAPGLSGIKLDTQVYRPASYLASALDNLGIAGLAALLLLLVALAALLLSWRLAVLAAFVVPLSLTAAAYVLHLRGEPLTTMTLVGLAVAAVVVVDDATGTVSDILRRTQVEDGPGERDTVTAVREVVAARHGPFFLATVVVVLLLVPTLLAGGVVGAFARPVVVSYLLAVLAAMLVAVTVTPILAVLLLRTQRDRREAGPSARWVRRGLERFVAPWWRHPLRLLLAAAVFTVVSVTVASQAGTGQALPTLHDSNVLVRLRAAPGTSLTEMDRVTARVAAELRTLDGVESAGTEVGRAIGADEVADVDAAEIWLKVAPDADHADTVDAIRTTVRGYAGLRSTVQTYDQERIAAASAGGGDGLVVRVYGFDLATLHDTAQDVAGVVGTVPGVLSPTVEAQATEPTVEIEVDLASARRYGLRPGDVRREASTLISGLTVGSLYEQQKIFDVVVWSGRATRHSLDSLESLRIDTPDGRHVPLGAVARARVAPDPVAISHHAVSRSLDVTANVEGRSAADVAQEVTERLRGLAMPYEYRAEVLPDATDREADHRRTILGSIGIALLILLLLQAATRSWRGAAALFLCLPLTLVGGVLVAPLNGGIGSVGVLAGLAAVLAVALRQALVLVRRAQPGPGSATGGSAVREAARQVAPAVVVSALVIAAVCLVPAVLGAAPGLEILHPFAVTVLGGLLSEVVVVLVLLPALFIVIADHAPRSSAETPATSPETEVPQ